MEKYLIYAIFLLSYVFMLVGCKTHSEIEKTDIRTEVRTESTEKENEAKDFHEEKTDRVESKERNIEAMDSVINDRTVEIVLNDKGDTIKIRERITERHVSKVSDNTKNVGAVNIQKTDSVSRHNSESVAKNDSVMQKYESKEKVVKEKGICFWTYKYIIIALLVLVVILYVKNKFF